MSRQWIKICSEDDLVIGSGICALLGEEQVALFRETSEGPVFAISNFDPFGEANVLSRGIIGSMGDKLVVASPLYKQHFCLASGQCLEDDIISVKTYPTKIESGQLFVQD